MNKFRIMSVFVILAMLFSFANVSQASAAGPNLIVNGSFEEPQLPVGTTWQYTYGISTPPVSPWLPWLGSESYPFALASGGASDGNQ